ncbi:hypothetical protein BH09PAT2_BH09PAT2_02870 [soil metagenome]
MKAKIAQANKLQIFENLIQIILPSTSGEIEILSDHAELFCLLKPGMIELKDEQKSRTINIEQSTAYFKDNVLIVVM